MDQISLDGRVAVITGAGRGLGRAHALELARRGAKIVINDMQGSTDMADAVEEIDRAGGVAIAIPGSVTARSDGQALIDETVARFGKVDILINNAGILRPGLLENLSEEAIDAVIDVHLKGAFNITQPAFKAMSKSGYGRIVNTSSGSLFGFIGMSNYAAAKAALLGFTSSLALEGEAHGIRINAILPASNTPMAQNALSNTPIPGFAADERWNQMRAIMMPRYHPGGVSALVALLASEACPISGQAFSAIAGRYARVFVGISAGWLSPDNGQMTAEDILNHFDEISNLENFIVPSKLRDEMESVADRVAELGKLT